MTDLTKITTPFGLLAPGTQEALRAHGGPYQTWYGGEIGWHEGNPAWDGAYAYRVKPQPPKPREWWIKFDPVSEMLFQRANKPPESAGYIHVREVLSDD